MDINEVKKLVKLVESSDIEELKIEEKDLKIRITKSKGGNALQPVAYQIPAQQPAPQVANTPQAQVQEAKSDSAVQLEDGVVEICSPMVGTFYRAASPEADPYINVGDDIQSGKVLCIIEAMKLMNELEAEVSGKIVKILVENAQPVEFNQPLFLIKKA